MCRCYCTNSNDWRKVCEFGPVSPNFVAKPIKVRIATSGFGTTCKGVRNGDSGTYLHINSAIHAHRRWATLNLPHTGRWQQRMDKLVVHVSSAASAAPRSGLSLPGPHADNMADEADASGTSKPAADTVQHTAMAPPCPKTSMQEWHRLWLLLYPPL